MLILLVIIAIIVAAIAAGHVGIGLVRIAMGQPRPKSAFLDAVVVLAAVIAIAKVLS